MFPFRHWSRATLVQGRVLDNSWCCWQGLGNTCCIKAIGQNQIYLHTVLCLVPKSISGRVFPRSCANTSDDKNVSTESASIARSFFVYFPYSPLISFRVSPHRWLCKDFYPTTLGRDLESKSRRFWCTSSRDLNSGRSTDWATAAAAIARHLILKCFRAQRSLVLSLKCFLGVLLSTPRAKKFPATRGNEHLKYEQVSKFKTY